MLNSPGLDPIDYLIVGHLTIDSNPEGPALGGTAAFSALTAKVLGLRVGIVTSWGEENGLELLDEIQIFNHPTKSSTTFESSTIDGVRSQKIRHIAPSLDFYHIPELWRRVPMVHLAPVASEVNPAIAHFFPDSKICLTAQGLLRQWDPEGRVTPYPWLEASYFLEKVDVAVISEQDVQANQDTITTFAQSSRVLAVTHGQEGVRIYFQGEIEHISAPAIEEVDATGAGDIFATAFFTQYINGKSLTEAAEFANQLAAISVTRVGLESTPTKDDLFEISSKAY